jgi:hypothetical protein
MNNAEKRPGRTRSHVPRILVIESQECFAPLFDPPVCGVSAVGPRVRRPFLLLFDFTSVISIHTVFMYYYMYIQLLYELHTSGGTYTRKTILIQKTGGEAGCSVGSEFAPHVAPLSPKRNGHPALVPLS